MKEFEDERDPREIEALHALTREKTPPVFLEQQIVGALKESGLIRSSWFTWQRRLVMTGSAIAVTIALFIGGVVVGGWWKSTPAVVHNAPEFMLLLRNSPGELPIRSADEEWQRIREYGAWAKAINQEGVLVDAEKLKDEARTLNVIDGRSVVSDMTRDARQEAIAGYFLIHARDYQEAIRIAENCPHVKYGGTIEIRQIDPVDERPN